MATKSEGSKPTDNLTFSSVTTDPKPADSTEKSDFPLTAGEYVWKPVDTVWTWPKGANIPNGFKRQNDGTAVLIVDDNGREEVDRDNTGQAGILHEDGALVYTSDGDFRTLDRDGAEEYARTHEPK